MKDTYSVYVQTDANGNIIAPPNSSAFLTDFVGWVKIDEGVGEKFYFAQGYYFNKPTMTFGGVYRYKLDITKPLGEMVVEKTDNEISAEEAAIVSRPTIEDRLSAAESAITALLGV